MLTDYPVFFFIDAFRILLPARLWFDSDLPTLPKLKPVLELALPNGLALPAIAPPSNADT